MIQYIKNIYIMYNKKSVIEKTISLINFNYNKSLDYTLPEILKHIIYYTNDLHTTRILYCTSKIFHPIIAKLKTLKYIGDDITIYPLLPCFKSARHIQFYNCHFDKYIILKNFTIPSTNNIICDILLSNQYHKLVLSQCYLQSYIMTYIYKNKSIKTLKLDNVDNFNDKMIFSYLMQHTTLNEMKIKNTNLDLESLQDDHIDNILHLTNNLTNKHCQYLCQIFKKNKINKISLINCGIHDAYFLLYIKFFIDTNINYIDLSYNLIIKDYHHFVIVLKVGLNH